MKFAGRLAVLSLLFAGLFAVLVLRLWSMQVAEGAQAAVAAEEQIWVEIPTQAPRGDIRDRNGNLLATSRYVPAIVVDRRQIRPEQREELVQRLSGLLTVPPSQIDHMYEEAGINGRFRVAVVDQELAYRINEQLRDFPGVSIEKVPERVYLAGPSMAHVVGHLGLPGEEDLAADPELDPNIRIGKLGVERVYDEWLRGTPGEIAYRVNRRSEVLDERPEVPARQGNTVYLTLDEELQVLVETALAEGIELSNGLKEEQRQSGDSEGARNQTMRGAAVVLDARTFEVLALSSIPSFDPQLFVSGLDPNTYAELQEQGAFLNLAVSGLYPPASTFKAVTYVTALEEDVPLPNGVEGTDPTSGLVHCDGQLQLPGFDPGSPQTFRDWYYPRNLGWLDLHGALEHSCNIYFYNIALGVWQTWKETPRENVIQDWARRLGYGSPTGIDLTGEQAGTIPDRALFEEWKQYTLDNPDRTPLIDRDRLELESPWLGGDLMNTAIGQGSVAATPLQVAVSYAAVANGGQLMTPYVVREVRDRDGNVVMVNQPELVAEVPVDPATVQSFLTDLNRVVTSGTAAAAFRDFGDSLYRVGGKTGTGQSGRSRDNHAWFAGVAPVDNPRWVVAVLIDQGGSGGAVAAPVARHIMQYLMGEQPTPITPGAVTD